MNNAHGGYVNRTFDAAGFFRVTREDGRWWLVDPSGLPFFIVGIAHVDDSALKYDESLPIWRERYGNRQRWIFNCVIASLRDWGFNTLAWTKQWVTPQMRHSPEWTPDEYRESGLAYIPHIDFLNIERWNRQAVYKDVFSAEFVEWCDYQARYWCAALADDPKLIGYAYTARPHWDAERFRATMGRPAFGSDFERDEFLRSVVRRYYQVTHDAIRRYDPNHLIFGDLVEGTDCLPQGPLEPPAAVFTEMNDYVDVLSINWYHPFGVIRETIERWRQTCDKPVFLGDSAFVTPNDLLSASEPLFDGGWEKLRVPTERARGEAYAENIREMAQSGYVLGWGWCSFMQNRVRRYGLKDRFDEPYECVKVMRDFNRDLYENLGWAPQHQSR